MVYVDKTKQIFDLFLTNKANCYHFIARPRRFGKSLTCSTIRALFSGDELLFKDLAISKESWNFQEENRPVILLELSNLGTNLVEMIAELSGRLDDVAAELLPTSDFEELRLFPPTRKFVNLIKTLSRQCGKQIVVVIDEYDAPVLDLLDKPAEQQQMVEVLASFYGVLKNLDKHFRMVYITGIFTFSGGSLFSKFDNNIVDHTFRPEAATLCGYTEEELADNYAPHLIEFMKRSAKREGTPRDAICLLREKFNGYCFGMNHHKDGNLPPRVYNPFTVNRALDSRSLVDHWLESGSSQALIRCIAKSRATGTALDSKEIPFSAFSKPTPGKITYEELMYFAGYSTIRSHNHEKDLVTLAAPYKGITDELLDGISYSLRKGEVSSEHLPLSRALVRAMFEVPTKGEVQKTVVEFLLNSVVAQYPHQLLMKQKGVEEIEASKASEVTYNAMFSSWLMRGCHGEYEDLTNVLSRNKGDVNVVMRNEQTKTVCLVISHHHVNVSFIS
jgi:hypothetical protein